MKQSLSQKLQQKLTPQQILLMKLIQLPATELETRLKKELEENPVLEEGASSDDLDRQELSSDDEFKDENELGEEDYYHESEEEFARTAPATKSEGPQFYSLSVRESFQEELLDQIHVKLSDEKERTIAEYLIGSLDDSGYLRRDLTSIVDDLAFTQYIDCSEDEVEKVLSVVQELDPPGVGARDLRESLLIQLNRKEHKDLITRNAIYIVEDLFDDFINKRYEKIVDKTNISEEDLREVLDEIKSLNPKPGEPQEDMDQSSGGIIPDFSVFVIGDDVKVLLNEGSLPELSINRSYVDMVESYDRKKDRSQKDTVKFIKNKLESAKWFIDAIEQRNNTLTKTMEAIVDRQKQYFLSGNEKDIRPMILKDIADVIDMDVSTISRVVNSKYVQSPYGIFKLKKFFSESFTTEAGEDVSTIQVKEVLKEIVGSEDRSNPLKDDEIVEELKKKGYPIARRTVAKYREQLGIPVARMRRKL